jgi:hypothetical protein
MIIKQIETKYLTEMPFAAILAPESVAEFQPHFVCEIVSDKGTHRGKGETEYASEQDAFESLKADLAAEAYTALEQYNARNGAGNLEIA